MKHIVVMIIKFEDVVIATEKKLVTLHLAKNPATDIIYKMVPWTGHPGLNFIFYRQQKPYSNMAKPIPVTPTIKGKAARIIIEEMQHGTPDTPERVETIRRADEVYKRVQKQIRAKEGDVT